MNWYNRLRLRLSDDPRISRVLHGSLSSVLARGLTLLINVVTLPLTLRYLGRFEYGIWATVSTSVVMLSVLDLGIANTLTNFIGEAYAEDDREKAQRYFATAFWVTVAVVAALGPLGYVAWRMIPWANVFHLTDPAMAQRCADCVAFAGGCFLLSLPLTLAGRVMSGYQQVHLANYFAMINSVFGLLAIVATLLLHGSLVMLVALYSMAMLTGPICLNVWLSFWQRPWIKPLPSKVTPAIVSRLFKQGTLFFIMQITTLIVLNSDNLVITHYIGASAVTPYSIAWKLTQYATLFQGLLIPSLWPAFTEAYHKRHMSWINATYRSIRRKTLIGAAGAGILIGLFGPIVIKLWLGAAAVPSRELIWLMAFFAFVVSATNNQSLVLAATGRLTIETTVAVLAAIANLALSIHLVKRMGVEGVILGTIISFLVVMIVPQGWEVRRVLAGRYLPVLSSEETETVT
jgi:O-antigen/teichoic acid export membrane protein